MHSTQFNGTIGTLIDVTKTKLIPFAQNPSVSISRVTAGDGDVTRSVSAVLHDRGAAMSRRFVLALLATIAVLIASVWYLAIGVLNTRTLTSMTTVTITAPKSTDCTPVRRCPCAGGDR